MNVINALPMMVTMVSKSCLVVGGGRVAERKAAVLLEAGASITVISPQVTEGIRTWADEHQIVWFEREYVSGDGEGDFLIVAATDRSDVNERVALDAKERGQLVNAAERPELGSVTLPAVLRRGRLVVAVSTTGASPAAAGAIRDRIDALLGDDAERLLELLERFRREAKARVRDAAARGRLLRELLRGDLLGRLQAAGETGWAAFEAHMQGQLEQAEAACAEGQLE